MGTTSNQKERTVSEKNEMMDALKEAAEKAGFKVMSDAEFQEWWAAREEYHQSPEAQDAALREEVTLDFLLDRAKYKFTEEMGEISGFGGSYEKACRVMLDAGLRWLDEHPDADPKFKRYTGVYGLIDEDNDDAEGLSAAVGGAVDGCSGAMHQAVVSSCLWIRKNGWDRYVEEMSKPEEPAPEGEGHE